VAQLKRRSACEAGFTLPEVLIVIVLMGIVLAIASSTWQRVVDDRNADSAANQLLSDLRLAHTKATNQLSDWRVVHAAGGADYQLVRVSDGAVINRSLPENTKISSSEVNVSGGQKKLAFKPNGEASAETGYTDADGDGQIDIVVSAADGSPQRGISVVPATSRVKVDY
jgi:prepilin-type N-terminal cleavage/methylation domain-containing protein